LTPAQNSIKEAVIFNILHYSIHDGPGIRTTVFFKGCPLSCKWCHNPESRDKNPLKIFDAQKCIKCKFCESSIWSENNCPANAHYTIGYKTDISNLMKEINKDLLFYEQSGGGVTFSGGEPFYQADFLLEILAKCKSDCIQTAIDTCGYCDAEILLKAAETTDYFLYDIKFIDNKKHKKFCGVSNEIILKNLKFLAEVKSKLLIRIPIIPGINDDTREMSGIYNFIKNFKNIEKIHLLPYHNIHSGKYDRIGMNHKFCNENGLEISGEESSNMNAIRKMFEIRFNTKIGG
jgi:pyruvate formate lyase activating enzyme